jgi:hypothetical protein
MKKKAQKALYLILILGGVAMSILNFYTPAYARIPKPLYGTITVGDGALSESFWYQCGRFLGEWGGNRWYCCMAPSTCCIVYAAKN